MLQASSNARQQKATPESGFFFNQIGSLLNANEIQVNQLRLNRVTLDGLHFNVDFFTVDDQGQHGFVEFRLLLGNDEFFVVNSDGLSFFAGTVDDGRNLVSVTQAAARTFPQVRTDFSLEYERHSGYLI
ncbi:conserved hypothetical protein [Aeromonas salmonicida]|nr:conserved hypothetical protein [Aeromonas salmonicida]